MRHKPTRKGRHKVLKHGLYLRVNEDTLDGRTWVAKFIQEGRRDLMAFTGNHNPLVERLIKRIVFKDLRLSSYELTCLEDPDTPGLDEYVRLANSFRRDLTALKELAIKKVKRVPTIEELMKE
jgi:hypothetical protein